MQFRRGRRLRLWLLATLLPLALLALGVVSPRAVTIELGEGALPASERSAAAERALDDAALSGWLIE